MEKKIKTIFRYLVKITKRVEKIITVLGYLVVCVSFISLIQTYSSWNYKFKIDDYTILGLGLYFLVRLVFTFFFELFMGDDENETKGKTNINTNE